MIVIRFLSCAKTIGTGTLDILRGTDSEHQAAQLTT